MKVKTTKQIRFSRNKFKIGTNNVSDADYAGVP